MCTVSPVLYECEKTRYSNLVDSQCACVRAPFEWPALNTAPHYPNSALFCKGRQRATGKNVLPFRARNLERRKGRNETTSFLSQFVKANKRHAW